MQTRHTALVLSALLAAAAHAQTTPVTAAPAPAALSETPAAATAMTQGEVRKVDLDSKKITLKHGAIKNLDMPPMTMVFGVKDAAMLNGVKAGDKVRFAASNDGGKMTVTELQAAK
jgi:Cu(I)/Ag(I) efflux system periplasmic protein CusF